MGKKQAHTYTLGQKKTKQAAVKMFPSINAGSYLTEAHYSGVSQGSVEAAVFIMV